MQKLCETPIFHPIFHLETNEKAVPAIARRSRKVLQAAQFGGVACGAVAEMQNCSNECVDCACGREKERGVVKMRVKS